jgi:hypothetical protein
VDIHRYAARRKIASANIASVTIVVSTTNAQKRRCPCQSSEHIGRVNRTTILRAAGLAAIFLGMPLYWWAFPPLLPVGTANGTFTSQCCGSMNLRDGVLTLGDGQKVSYVVEHDNVGRFVLLKGYVGAAKRGLIFDRDGNPLYRRLDGETRPSRIEVTDNARGEVVAFDRRSGS